jgi:hypothetical protein
MGFSCCVGMGGFASSLLAFFSRTPMGDSSFSWANDGRTEDARVRRYTLIVTTRARKETINAGLVDSEAIVGSIGWFLKPKLSGPGMAFGTTDDTIRPPLDFVNHRLVVANEESRDILSFVLECGRKDWRSYFMASCDCFSGNCLETPCAAQHY